MWHYNFDYLSHGTNGYKYIDKYRGKNGKWQYVYETPLQNMGRRAEYRINHPLSTSQKLLYPGQNKSVDEVGYGKRPTKKLSIRREVDNTSSSGGRGTNSKWTKVDAILELANSEAAKPSTRKSEIRQKVDPAIDQKAREREIAKGKAAAKDYRQSKVTVKDVQREREREIKSGMSSNRQWNRDRVSKGSSVEAAQKARERGIAEGKASAKQYSTSVGAKKNAELAKILGNMINETKSDIKKNVHANFKTNEAQKGRAEDINKSVEAAREAQRKKENSLGARIKRNIEDDVATAKALDSSKAKSPKEIIKSNARDIVEGKVNSMSKEEQKWANAAKQQEREHSRTTAAIDAQNARQRAIEASQARQRQAAAAKQQEEERKQAGNRSVERAQNAREAAITSSQARQRQVTAAKQQEAERKKSGTLSKAYVDQKNRNKEMEVSKKIANFQNLTKEAKNYVSNYINAPKDFDTNSKIKRARVFAEYVRILDDPDLSTKQKEDLAQNYWGNFSIAQENTRQLRNNSREPNKEESDLFYKLTNSGYLYDNDSRKLDALRLDYRMLKNDSTASKELLDFIKNKIEELEKKELASKRVDRR